MHQCWQPFGSENSLFLMTLNKNLPQILIRSWLFSSKEVWLYLIFGYGKPSFTPVMGISCPGSFGKDSLYMLKSIGFRDLFRLFSSLIRSDRVYLGWFAWDLGWRLFKMQALRQLVKAHYGSGPIVSSFSTGFQVYL